MSEGIQITIPDFDDDDYSSAPTPFGRSTTTTPFGNHGGFSAGGFGSSGFGFGSSGPDSPSLTTPMAADPGLRSYFPSHARADSEASLESTNSGHTRYPPSTTRTLVHGSSASIATTSTGFTKKPSFPSLRNPFKSNKSTSNDAPPMPPLDQHPFGNRSTSSLGHGHSHGTSPGASHGPFRGMGMGMSITNPSFARPPTPGAASRTRTRNHAPAKSYHSQTGSIFHNSESGSDHGHATQTMMGLGTPPPVPRVPNGMGVGRSETPPYEDDKVVVDHKTPSDYALHAVFIRFVSTAESKIDSFLRQGLDTDPLLPDLMDTGKDPEFDSILSSLAKIAQKNAKPVIDSIMRWRRQQQQRDSVPRDLISFHATQSPQSARVTRTLDIPNVLNERKDLVSVFIMCRALIVVVQGLSKDALGEATGHMLEETTFDRFRKPNAVGLSGKEGLNYRINADLCAKLLGHIANIRFMNVTDRFLAELEPVKNGLVPKDSDMKYENLVRGLKHIQIKVYPPEAFEEGAEFLEYLSASFAKAHGQRLKTVFSETLVHILHPIGKTAQAETNHPQWAAAIEIIYPKARDLMTKPRYWSVAFPLAVTSLCVAHQTYFLKHWQGFFEGACARLKEKPQRTIILNGLLRLLWTYLYRCQESPSTTTSKLDSLMKHFFPPNRLPINPPDERIEPFVHFVHFILSRHFDFGKELVLDLLQEAAIAPLQHSGNIGPVLAPERISIAAQALLLSLSAIERESFTPTWPPSTEFSEPPALSDYPSSSDYLPASILARPGMAEFFDRCASTLATVAIYCSDAVGHMSFFDEQWLYSRLNLAYEEAHNYIIRRHHDGPIVAYPNHFVPQISLLQTCFSSWPRCLHPSISLVDAANMLLKGLVHVEPAITDASAAALKQFMTDRVSALTVLSRFSRYLFTAHYISQSGLGPRLLIDIPRVLNLWVDLVDGWIHGLLKLEPTELFEHREDIFARCNEIEGGALFLITSETQSIQVAGIKVLRLLGLVIDHLSPLDTSAGAMLISKIVHGKTPLERTYLTGFDDVLEPTELSRLDQWRQSTKNDIILRIADSANEKDCKIWPYVFPAFLQACQDAGAHSPQLRESLIAAGSRYHPTIAHLAGLSSRVPAGMSSRTGSGADKDGWKLVKDNRTLVDQWRIWVKILCSTASLPESHRPALTQLGRDHARAPSDASFERERLSTTRGLFRYLTPFLDSEYTKFRDTAVLCISSFPSAAYPQLLEDLSLLAGRQFYDDPRSKASEPTLGILSPRQFQGDTRFGSSPIITPDRSRRQERLHSAVARIYFLTAHLLQTERSAGRQAALANVLKFVRNTQTFLTAPDARDNYTLQRLRRYFCGTVERLFDGLATIKDSDRFIPSHMHLSLFRLCEEWCHLGPQPEYIEQRNHRMQSTAIAHASASDAAEARERFRTEAKMLSYAAIGAIAALCQKALFTGDLSAASPSERLPPELVRALTPVGVLDRLSGILKSAHPTTKSRGKKALRSILLYNSTEKGLLEEALRRSAVFSDETDTSESQFFEVVSEIVRESPNHGFTFAQIACLGLINLRHPDVSLRQHAFNMLEAIHEQSSGLLSLSNLEASIGSCAPGTYTNAHRHLAELLAGEHPEEAANILTQFATALPQFPDNPTSTTITLLLLQSLEFWIPNVKLMPEDCSEFSPGAFKSMYHLVALSLRYGRNFSEQISVIWSKMVSSHPTNGHATLRFLLEHSNKVGSVTYVECAASIVACLCQTSIGEEIYEELCSVIEPARMLPTIEHKLKEPEASDFDFWADLGALFEEEPRLPLGSAQYAWLFLTDVAVARSWEFKESLPTLLHVLFAHLDHRIPFIRQRAQQMLFQVVRSWVPGYDEIVERSANPGRAVIKNEISSLEKDAEDLYWREDDSSAIAEPKMKQLADRIINILSPLRPALSYEWGALALNWGTTCSIRGIAFRSLQIFRSLMPRVKQRDLAVLLGRLSNTISSSDQNLQSFTCEVLSTITAITKSGDVDWNLLPQIFWCACASLSTTIQVEFEEVLALLDVLLTKVDLDDEDTIELLLARRPQEWKGPSSLQPALLKGLRSSQTSEKTFKILCILTKNRDGQLVDDQGTRIRDVYTVVLPWCLHAMTEGKVDDNLKRLADDISALAAADNRVSISKIMNSFSKSHFRTRDDFLRQFISSLREHYGSDSWTEVVTLLLGLVLNQERWMRTYAMQALKVLFQQRETQSPFEQLGSELLMPLLRLLETDLAPQALDVLDEPIKMSGGLAAKHVLRMSMHSSMFGQMKPPEPVGKIFGVPEESGWCVAQAEQLQEQCRENLVAVFDTCSMPFRPSRIDFEPEVHAALASPEPTEDEVSDLVNDLHEMKRFLERPASRVPPPLTLPNRHLEARVAAILAKTTASESHTDMPQTPFIDVFRISGIDHDRISDDGSDYTDSESEADAFIFDSPALSRNPRTPHINGFHHHH